MKPLPTDLAILNEIYDRYYNEFAYHAADRDNKAIVPIKIEDIAQALGVDADIVFGRLYYHLQPKYRYQQTRRPGLASDTVVTLFLNSQEFGFNAVHFPYMASVLAELRADDKKHRTQTNIAWFSLAISGLAVLVSIIALSVKG